EPDAELGHAHADVVGELTGAEVAHQPLGDVERRAEQGRTDELGVRGDLPDDGDQDEPDDAEREPLTLPLLARGGLLAHRGLLAHGGCRDQWRSSWAEMSPQILSV